MTMKTQEAYAARLDAQMRVADARLDEMEAGARARNARAEMDEISGLRARRDQIRQQLTTAKSDLQNDWDAIRRRVDANWADFRRDVADRHDKYTQWDEARERRFVAHLDEAESALRESAGRDAESAANARIALGEAQEELRDKAAAARQKFEAGRERRYDEKIQKERAQSELELEEALNFYASVVNAESQL
jgi:hypothetical protein